MTIPIVAIFSIFSEARKIDLMLTEVKAMQPTSVSFDRDSYIYSKDLCVVQAYFHIECDNVTNAIRELRSSFQNQKTRLEKMVEDGAFLAFSEHWFSEPNTIFPSDLSRSNSDPYLSDETMIKDYGGASVGRVMFIDRPSYQSESNHSITLIEVPKEVETNLALELAHHKQHALRCILCSIDLLSAKVAWLGRNVLGKAIVHPDRLVEKFRQDFGPAWDKTQEGKVLGNSKADILTPLAQVSSCIASLQMTGVMIDPIERQLSLFKKSLLEESAGLVESKPSEGEHAYCIKYAISEIHSLERQLAKYSGILQGIREAYQSRNLLTLSKLEEVSEANALQSQLRFNFLTLLLAVIAVALGLIALIDNDSTKALLYCWDEAWDSKLKVWQVSLTIFETKAVFTVVVILLAILVPFLYYRFEKNKEKKVDIEGKE